jgi:hypothetical protein
MAKVVMVATVCAAAGTGVAVAGTTTTGSIGTTSGNGSLLGGNQVSVPVSVPVSICGDAIAVLGDALGVCAAEAPGDASVTSAGMTSGDDSVLGGNQVSVPVNVPVTVCGAAVAVLGAARGDCAGGAPSPSPQPSASGAAQPGDDQPGDDQPGDHDQPGSDGGQVGDSDHSGAGGQVGDSDDSGGSADDDASGQVSDDSGSGQPGGTSTPGSQHGRTSQQGTGTLAQLSARTTDGALPITGTDIAGLLALAAAAIAAGTGALVLTGRLSGGSLGALALRPLKLLARAASARR